MISTSNYFSEIARIGIENLPDTLRKGHNLVEKSTDNGASWSAYQDSAGIRRVIDLYLEKLNEFVSSRSDKSVDHQKMVRKEAPSSTSIRKEPKLLPKEKHTEAVPNKSTKFVEHLREEIKFIRRYIGLHNKVKTPKAILNFIKSLQRSIIQKLIRKTSPLAHEIEMIQDKLIKVSNKMKGEESFAINEKDLQRLVAIVGGERVYPSIGAIKRFIGLQGQQDEKKINSFLKYLSNLLSNKEALKDDPYVDKLKAIQKAIKNRTGSKIAIGKAELSGLSGIAHAANSSETACTCESSTKRNIQHGKKATNQGLHGVLTAVEMANRKLDLLNFTSFWYSLIGNPARNFTLMLHGEPHNGKTIFLLKLAQYLAENFGDVLYISSEEFASPTMTKKVGEFLNPLPARLHFAENLQAPDLSHYQFVILDSVNDLGLKAIEYKELRKAYPETAFIFILQHTKAGDFRGGKDWEHMAEIAGEVSKGVVTITKNRYAPKAVLDFFRQLGIPWQEPN